MWIATATNDDVTAMMLKMMAMMINIFETLIHI